MNTIKLSVEDWIENNFPLGSSRPTAQTVRNMIRRGEITGKKFGRRWYIVTEITTGNAETDAILRAIS